MQFIHAVDDEGEGNGGEDGSDDTIRRYTTEESIIGSVRRWLSTNTYLVPFFFGANRLINLIIIIIALYLPIRLSLLSSTSAQHQRICI